MFLSPSIGARSTCTFLLVQLEKRLQCIIDTVGIMLGEYIMQVGVTIGCTTTHVWTYLSIHNSISSHLNRSHAKLALQNLQSSETDEIL